MTRAELDELREAWAHAVLLGEDAPREWRVPLPCWFSLANQAAAETEMDYGPCDGRIEGAHWIKRQTVERWVLGQVPIDQERMRILDINDLVDLAAWDPRNGVPACHHHHTAFDSQRVPLPSEQIVVWRHQVPAHVEAFAADLGLEHELDRKHPMEAIA